MNIEHTAASSKAFEEAPRRVQKAFLKQVGFLKENLHHPSLRAKKYSGAKDIWQARVNQDWRFYFQITRDAYVITNIIPHPK